MREKLINTVCFLTTCTDISIICIAIRAKGPEGPTCQLHASEGPACRVRFLEGRVCRVRYMTFDYPF